jgi:hypothetical protein
MLRSGRRPAWVGLGLHGIVWESMGKSRLAVGCARRATPVTRSPQSRSAVEKPSAALTKIAEIPAPPCSAKLIPLRPTKELVATGCDRSVGGSRARHPTGRALAAGAMVTLAVGEWQAIRVSASGWPLYLTDACRAGARRSPFVQLRGVGPAKREPNTRCHTGACPRYRAIHIDRSDRGFAAR